MDAKAFHGLAGEFVEIVKPHSEADPSALLVTFLCAAGNLFGRGPHHPIEGDQHPGKLFVGIVGNTSSGRKGTSWSRVRQVFARTDEAWVANIGSGLVSGEGLIWALRDPTYKQVQPKKNGRPDGEPYEELDDEGVADKRLLVKEAEMGRLLRSMKRQGNTLSELLRELWDTADARSMSKNSPGKATGAMLSVLCHITADELRRELTDIEAANGFSNRFLWVYSKRSQLLSRGGQLDAHALDDIAGELRRAQQAASVVGVVDFDGAAWELWDQHYERLTGDRPGLGGSILARGAPQVVRLSLVYALLDRASEIRRDHLEAALAVWAYCEASVQLIFGHASGYPDADRALEFIREGEAAGRTKTEIRDLFGRNKPTEPVLAFLSGHGLAAPRVDPDAEGPGRRTETWIATEYDINDRNDIKA
jgi:hypothetical protein